MKVELKPPYSMKITPETDFEQGVIGAFSNAYHMEGYTPKVSIDSLEITIILEKVTDEPLTEP